MGLDDCEPLTNLPLVLARRHFRSCWFAGLVLLVAAQLGHAYDHWEMAVHLECVAHAPADGDHGDGGSRHDHGCTSHDHAPALTSGMFALTVTQTMAAVVPDFSSGPSPQARSIDHPPQLS